MKLKLTLVLSIAALLMPSAAEAKYCAHPGQQRLASMPYQYPLFYRALRAEFGRAWREAAVVSYGEGSWHKDASNGQYLGTFQMGSWARSSFGHSYTLAGQARHAARYWRKSGWSGWECKPY